MATYQACQVIGMPECRINLAHLVSYLSEAPTSTRAYEGYKRAEEAANLDRSIPVPFMMRNAPTGLMKELGYARGYKYNPEYACVNFCLPICICVCVCIYDGELMLARNSESRVFVSSIK